MPLTKTGEKVMHSMMEQYGPEKGKKVFYASENKGVSGSKKWTKKKKKSSGQNYSREHVAMARKMMGT